MKHLGILLSILLYTVAAHSQKGPDFANEVKDPKFRICLFGDTQMYVDGETWDPKKRDAIERQRDMIAHGHCDAALHMGDMTNVASDTHSQLGLQWERIHQVYDPVFPIGGSDAYVFSPAQGNHDNPTKYREALAKWDAIPGRPNKSYFSAISPSGMSHSLFTKVGGVQQLIVSVRCGWPRADVEFLQQQIEAHPGVPTIVHSHTAVLNGRLTSVQTYGTAEYCPNSVDGVPSYTGDELETLFRDPAFDQVYLVAGGHWRHLPRASFDAVRNATHPSPLILVETNFQKGFVNGGDGWTGIVEVDTGTGVVMVQHYNPRHAVYMGIEDNAALSHFFDSNWKQRGWPKAGSPNPDSLPKPSLSRRTTGYFASPHCKAAYFINDGFNGVNNCKPYVGDPYAPDLLESVSFDYLRAAPGVSQATGDPFDLPLGSSPGSTGFKQEPGMPSGSTRRSFGPTYLFLGDIVDLGFFCVWFKTYNAPPDAASAVSWVSNADAGSGFYVGNAYNGYGGLPDGTAHARITTRYLAFPDAIYPGQIYQHRCLGWSVDGFNEVTGRKIYTAAHVVDGSLACPDGGCPTFEGTSITTLQPLVVGLAGGTATADTGIVMHELLFVRGLPLTAERARWIMACGADGNADQQLRTDWYLGGDLGEIEGPNGERTCPSQSQ